MNSKRLAAVLVVFAAFASIAGATCVVRHRAAVVNTAVVATAVTPVVAVPAYGATYDDGAATQNQIKDLTKRLADAEARIAVLESARDNLTARLTVVESKHGIATPPPAAPAPAPAPAPKKEEGGMKQEAKVPNQTKLPALVARSCAKCHNSQKASGGLELVDARGNLTKLASDLRLEVLRRANLPADNPQVMPPQKDKLAGEVKKTATDEEFAELFGAITKK